MTRLHPCMWRNLRPFLIFIFFVSCVEPFNPVIESSRLDALVVDAHIDSDGKAFVRLSRSLPLNSYANFPVQEDAVVKIEAANGEVFTLNETQAGVYTASNLNVDYETNYTLRIRTPEGREYFSDEVRITATPGIDRVYYTFSPTGDDVEVRVDSRDTNPEATGYYLWESIETYEYHSLYFSRFKRVDGRPMLRGKGEFVDTCWREVKMPVVISTTKRLADNIISGQRLTILNKLSPKISMRYSILVRQRAISEQEFTYRTQLSKTTDQQGSIFAEIPGAVVGNIHSTTSNQEVILGYFRGQEIKEQRFFINRSELPEQFQIDLPPPEHCDLEATCPTNQSAQGPNQCIDIDLLSDAKIIITAFEFRNSAVFLFSEQECGDCRINGGTTTMPDFW
jgi:hypothetical protein